MYLQRLSIVAMFMVLIFATEAGVVATSYQAEDKPGKKSTLQSEPAFVLAKIETQVQRRTLGISPTDAKSRYYLELNGNRFLESNQGSNAAWNELEKRINALKGDDLFLFQSMTFFGELPDTEFSQGIKNKIASLIKKKLTKEGNRTSFNPDPAEWTSNVKSFEATGTVKKEIVFGNDDVSVYSVEAPLSRYLTNGSACHIEVLSSLKQENGFLTKSIRQTISRIVKKHDIRKDGRLDFEFNRIEGSDGWSQKLKAEVKAFSKSIGFSGATFTYSPTNVERTEAMALVGKKAIDFELEDWKSGEMRKLSSINKNKFIILNFWGNT